MAKRIAIIINGSKRLNGTAKRTIELLKKEFGDDCETFSTDAPKHAIQLARESCNSGYTHLLAVGGDGTCHEVVNGIQQSKCALKVVFGIIPNGTGNDFFKSIGEFNTEGFLQAIKTNSIQQIDLIQVISEKSHSFALNIAGTGFDGYVVQTLQNMRKSFFKGKLAYVLAILRSFFIYKKPKVKIESSDFNYAGKMLLCAACNGTTFGYGLTINPDAQLNDGEINVALFGDVSLFDYLKNLGKIKRGEKLDHPEVHYYKTKQFKISAINNAFTEIDGEAFDEGTIQFSIRQEALKILAI